MKVGIRTPSPTRSVKARTTGRVKRAVKKSINPVYGKKGVGLIKDPERAVYNKIYHKVTVDPLDPIKHPDSTNEYKTDVPKPRKKSRWAFVLSLIMALVCFGIALLLTPAGNYTFFIVLCGVFIIFAVITF